MQSRRPTPRSGTRLAAALAGAAALAAVPVASRAAGDFAAKGPPEADVDTSQTRIFLNVPVAGPIVDLELELEIEAQFADNLDVFLVHGDTTVQVYDGQGDTNTAGIDATFDDEAGGSYPSTGDVTGTFKPSPGSLAAFDGQELSGLWELRIVDPGDAGAPGDGTDLLGWTLTGFAGSRAPSKKIALYADPAFVDVGGGSGSEGLTLEATLTALGHDVTPFTGTAEADFAAALADADLLVIPEQEVDVLAPALSPGASGAIGSFVAGGGRILLHGGTNDGAPELINSVFGVFSVSEQSASGPHTLEAPTLGTTFQGAPATLPDHSLTDALVGLPGNAETLYGDSSSDAVVTRFPFAGGEIVYVGWDWFDGAPLGDVDDGWVDVLQRLVVDDRDALLTPRKVSIFVDSRFVDVDTTPENFAEGKTMPATLRALGHDVTEFDGTSATRSQGALTNADVLVIPELETGDLFGTLEPGAISAIGDFVDAGGVIIQHVAFGEPPILNDLFGFSISTPSGSGATDITSSARGTRFENGPPTIGGNNAVGLVSGLPPGAFEIYRTSPGAASVAWIPVGLGRAIYMGWDWFNAAPLGSQDAGWSDVLDRAVREATVPVPEPTSTALAAAALGTLAALRRRRART